MWEVLKNSPSVLQLNEFETLAALCFRAMETSDHDVRIAISHLLGHAATVTLNPPKLVATRAGVAVSGSGTSGTSAATLKSPSVEEVLGIISMGFLRGGGGFLKGTGEMIKGPAATSREVRVGVTMVKVVCSKMIISIVI